MIIKNIIVMADFCSTGLWRKGKGCLCGLMLEYEDLKLPKELISEFKKWVKSYDKAFIGLAIGKKKIANKTAVEKVNSVGLILSKKLKKLFPNAKILYYYEDNKGNTKKPPVEIK